MRRYGLYFMSSTRWEVLRRFCDKWEEEDWGGGDVSRVFAGRVMGVGSRGSAGGSRGSRRVLRRACHARHGRYDAVDPAEAASKSREKPKPSA